VIDVERELRALLERKGGEVWLTPTIPPPVLRRARVRRVKNAVAGSAASVVIVAGAFAGVRGLIGPNGSSVPAVARVASARLGVSVSKPRGWRLAFGGDRAGGRTHLLTLSNGPIPSVVAVGSAECAPVPSTMNPGLRPGQEVLYILELTKGDAAGKSFTVAFGGTRSPFIVGDYPCYGHGGLFRFTREGRYFEAFLAGGYPGGTRATAMMLQALRSLQFGPPASPSPVPTILPAAVFDGIWPDDTPAELAAAQTAVDAGHLRWRLDPVQVALRFAGANGWPVTSATKAGPGRYRVSGAQPGSLLEVRVAQPGVRGPKGAWVVTRVTAMTPGVSLSATYSAGAGGGAGSVSFQGSTTGFADGTALTLVVSAPDPTSPGDAGTASVGVTVTGSRFQGSVPVPVGLEPWVVLSVRSGGLGAGSVVLTESTLGIPSLGG
jgi:hypothetical protein